MEWPDGPQLQGFAAIIAALGIGGVFGVRGIRKQRAGVPPSEAEIDANLVDDKKALQKDVAELQAKLTEEAELRREQAELAEQRRLGEARIYTQKISEVVQQRNELAEIAARNRRRFIEKYGEEELRVFIDTPDFPETWSASELREFKRLADDANG